MKQALLVLMVVASVGTARADTFELVTFTPPPGWSRLQVQRGVAFGHGNDGMLLLHPSQPVRGNATADFAALWRELVEQNGAAAPVPQRRAKSGIEIVVGSKQVVFNRATAFATLTVIVANGRVQPIVTATSSEQTVRDVTAFFQTMTVGAASSPSSPSAPATQPAAAGGGLDVDFDVPAGFTRQDNGPNVWFIAQKGNTGRFCSYALAPARASRGDLEADARAAAVEMFGNIRDQTAQRGTMPAGWSYFALRFDGVRSNPNGSRENFNGMTMAYAAVDGRIHIAFGYGNTACLFQHDAGFTDLLVSVRPTGWIAKATRPAFSIVGNWYAPGGISLMYSFDASGHYIITAGTWSSTHAGAPKGYVIETFHETVPVQGAYTLRNGELSFAGHAVKVRLFEERYQGAWQPGIGMRGPDGEGLFYKTR